MKEALLSIQNNINKACACASRLPSDVTLIAVSKTKPVSAIQEAYKLGCRDFGENKVQELVEKYEQLPKDIKWHMIGHLQRNKVKYIIDKVSCIHSVDSYELAVEIDRQATLKNIDSINILIEVNVGEEDSKFGLTILDTIPLIHKISQLNRINIIGLMTVAPFVENPSNNRVIFSKLRQLLIDIKSENIDNNSIVDLSMGMSNDYEVAIECGATMVRIGSDLFGLR